MAAERVEDAVVVGGGPAGYTAAIYLARERLAPLVVEGFAWGGLLQLTTTVENFPGFPDGIQGPDLMVRMRRQAERAGARLLTDEAVRVELGDGAGTPHRVHTGDRVIEARALLLATGADHRRLGVPGEEELTGYGVSYCAVCDAPFFGGARAVVIGGGDGAVEEALALARHAEHVTLVHRRERFAASEVMLDRVRALGNVDLLTPYAVERFVAGPDGELATVVLREAGGGALRELAADGAFVAIGQVPRSELVAGQVALHATGHVVVGGGASGVGPAGVFAAGDLVDRRFRQAVTAAGSGAQAAIEMVAWLQEPRRAPSGGPTADRVLARPLP